jgi:serine/threonine-protein kinase
MKVGSYEVSSEIGRGGMGVVYRARSPEGRDVAVKVVRDADALNALARFDRERRLASQLGEDDGFVPLLEAGAAEDGPYLVFPFIGGGTLRERLGTAWSVSDTVELGRSLGRALGRAHSRGIVHRDLKPENILYSIDGKPLIGDLGLAKHFRHDGASSTVSLTRAGHMVGTAGYMAPEQILDGKNAGPAADVFAVALLLHECLTGAPAFSGQNPAELLANIAECKIVSLRDRRPDMPSELHDTLERALAANPQLRFENGEAFAKALEGVPTQVETANRAGLIGILVLIACVAALAIMGRRMPEQGAAPPNTAAQGSR